MHLYVRPDGRKSWELRYKVRPGYCSFFGIGSYGKRDGTKSAAKARAKEAELLSAMLSSETLRDTQARVKGDAKNAAECTLDALTQEWLAIKKRTWVDTTYVRNDASLKKHISPKFGARLYTEIKAKEWLDLVHAMQSERIVEMASRVLTMCRDILDLAVSIDRMEANPLACMHKRLETRKAVAMRHVTQKELPDLIRAIRQYNSREGAIGLQLLMLLACCPSELRGAEWSEFDF